MAIRNIAVRGSAKYGEGDKEVDIVVDIEIGLAPLTILIGPNLSGKSLLLCGIHSAVSRGTPRTCGHVQLDVERDIEEGHVLFLDAYRASRFIYELVEGRLRELRRIIEDAAEYIQEEGQRERVVGYVADFIAEMERHMTPEYDVLLNAKVNSDDDLHSDAMQFIEGQLSEFRDIARELGTGVDDLLPIRVWPVRGGFAWSDVLGPSGRGVLHLSSVFASSMVVTAYAYAYALSRNPTYLLVEEPEIHAHPLHATFLGYLAAAFAKRATEKGLKLWMAISTHSMDFLRGVLATTNEAVKVYTFKRRRVDGAIRLEAEPWTPGAYVPGFTDAAALALGKRRRGA